MLVRILLGLSLLVGVARAAIGLDSTYDQVIAEKGQPSGKMQAGNTVVLRYADATIKLKAGKVVSVQPANGAESSGTSMPAPAPAPSAGPADARKVQGSLTWRVNYRAALADAKELKRHVFLLFTGSDWCPWCMALQKEALATKEFAAYANDNLVLVEVDFPREKFQSDALKKQNETLQRTFQVTGYPTVVVLDESGKQIGVTGYMPGGPQPLIKALKDM